MERINWAGYDFDDFELFCSTLFSFEFGKWYQPFLAQGRDGGVDGSYEGTYDKYSGRWRFQFKFSTLPRAAAVSKLRTKIQEESAKMKDEDFFVFATNVDLLPQEHTELADLFTKSLTTKDAKIFIWDGAKLNVIALKYPVLTMWFLDGFKSAQIVPYRIAFRRALNDDKYRPLTMANFFVGRDEVLETLLNWLTSDQSVAVLEGEGGIGKTRLVLEFFQRKVDRLPDWIPLVLVSRFLNFNKLSQSLSSNQKTVILVDDAHSFPAETIVDLKKLSDNCQNVKILLTARKLETSRAMSLIREYEINDILRVPLSPLTRVETEAALSKHLEVTFPRVITDLAEMCYGKPILIVAVLNAVNNGTPIHEIRKDDFFQSYVRNYFDTYITDIKEETGLARLKVKSILRTVTLLEPFDFFNADIITRISLVLQLSFADVKLALQKLVVFAFASGTREHCIRPDYYSDILLSECSDDHVLSTLDSFPDFAENIIINLSSVDEIASWTSRDLLENVLSAYVGKIRTSNVAEIEKILSTVLSIVYVQPELSKITITIFLSCFHIEHPIARMCRSTTSYDRQLLERCLTKAIAILDRLTESIENRDFVLSNALKLYKSTQDERIANIFEFDTYDIAKNFSMARQSTLMDRMLQDIEKMSDEKIGFFSLCIAKMLVLEFRVSEWRSTPADGVTIYTYFLPSSAPVKILRQRAIDMLFKLFHIAEGKELKSKLIGQILDVPRQIVSTGRNQKPYKNDLEIEAVLKFLLDDFELLDLQQRREARERVYQYEKWGITKRLGRLVEEVKVALTPRDLVDELSFLFSRVSMSSSSSSAIDRYMSMRCRELVSKHETSDISQAVVTFLASQSSVPYLFHFFQHTIEDEFPDLAKDVYERLFANGGDLFLLHGTPFLSARYLIKRDVKFFWQEVKKLKGQSHIDRNQVLLTVYARSYFKSEFLTDADTNLILEIYEDGRAEDRFLLAQVLHLLFWTKHSGALETCSRFLLAANRREAEHFFTFLAENEAISYEDMSRLILIDSIRFDISYPIEKCLNRILLSDGVSIVFQYLLKRFEHKSQSIQNSENYFIYEFVPSGGLSHLFDDAERCNAPMFEAAVAWYIGLDALSQDGHDYFAKNLIEYLLPSKSMNDAISSWYSFTSESISNELQKLRRLVETIAVFEKKNLVLIELVGKILAIANSKFEIESDEYSRFWFTCYDAILQVGAKSGTYGMPFQEDLDLKQLIEEAMNQYPVNSEFRMMLTQVHKKVQSEISWSIERGETSSW